MLNQKKEEQITIEDFHSEQNCYNTKGVNVKEQSMTFGDEMDEKEGIRFGEEYRRQLLEQSNSTSFMKLNKQLPISIDLADIDLINTSNFTNKYQSISPQPKIKKQGYIRDGKYVKTSSSFQRFVTQKVMMNKKLDSKSIIKSKSGFENVQSGQGENIQSRGGESDQSREGENNQSRVGENNQLRVGEKKEESDQEEEEGVEEEVDSQKNISRSRVDVLNNQNSEHIHFIGKNEEDKRINTDAISHQFNQLSSSNNQTQNNQLWLKSFFIIIGFIGRFKYHIKKQLIFRNPDLLQKNQIMMIDDKGAKGIEELDQHNSLKHGLRYYTDSHQSKYRCLRRLYKKMRMFRKNLKVICLPVLNCVKKLSLQTKVLCQKAEIGLFSPVSLFIVGWDIINIGLIFIQTLYISFNLSFGNHLNLPQLEFTTELFLICNLFVQSNLSYYHKGIQIHSRTAILNHCFRNIFLTEVLALIALFMPNGNPLQLLFFFKFPQFHNVVNKYKENNQFNLKFNLMFNVLVLLIEVIQFGHFLCCCWYMLGRYNLDKGSGSKSWMMDIDQQNIQSLYITSLYFCVISITTIGYGDIVAKNDNERIFVIFMSLTATGIFGYTVNRMNNILDEYYKLNNQFRMQLSDINYYMNQREVSQKIQNRARNYLEYIYKEGYINNEKIYKSLNSLSKNIIESIEGDVFYKTLRKIDLFSKNFSKEFLQRVALKVTELNYAPDEDIIKRGNVENPVLYFIIRGEVEIFVESNQDKYAGMDQVKSFCVLEKNASFGLDRFLIQEQGHTYSARSKGISRIQSLQSTDFFDVIREFPKDREIYQNIKDRLLQHKAFSESKLHCYSCKSSRHLVGNCPFIQYIPNQHKLYNNYLRLEKQQLQEFKRTSIKQKFATLSRQAEVEEGMLFLLEQNNLIEWISEESQDENIKPQKNDKELPNTVTPTHSRKKQNQSEENEEAEGEEQEEEIEQIQFEKRTLQLLISRNKSKDIVSSHNSQSKQNDNSSVRIPIKENDNKSSNISAIVQTNQDNKMIMPMQITDQFKDSPRGGDFTNLFIKQESENILDGGEQYNQAEGNSSNKNSTYNSKHKKYSVNIKSQKSPIQNISHFKKDHYNHTQNSDECQQQQQDKDDFTPNSTQQNIKHLISKLDEQKKTKQLQQQQQQQQQQIFIQQQQLQIQQYQQSNKQSQMSMQFLQNNYDYSPVQNEMVRQQNLEYQVMPTTHIQWNQLNQNMLYKQNDDFDILREYHYYFPHNNVHQILKKINEKQPIIKISKFSSLKKIKRSKTVRPTFKMFKK